ncbi:MAG: hypothetical protein IKK09_12320 [Clostridia bacterium]|nr:hypothetical protein [Clostridia bacterium]
MLDCAKIKYPVVFVHGMFGWGDNEGINNRLPYWGATTGSISQYLSDKGIQCFCASVGPLSSAWDQACELYAQLKGTRVDYGEAHSRKYGHKRYGRTYEKPLFENLSSYKKVHLVGHSFGGNTIRLLAHLLKYGSPEERQVSEKNVSPLFIGGQENLVCSVTAICSPLNGTNAYETARRYKLIAPMKFLCYNYAAALSRTRLHGRLVDFHLEQFGVNDIPGEDDKKDFVNAVKTLFANKDSIEHDMSEKGAAEINRIIKNVPEIYYFSYPYNCVESNSTGKSVSRNVNFPLLKFTCALMLCNARKTANSALKNDGLVDVASAEHPANEPFTRLGQTDDIVPGLWNVMPVRRGDHGTPIGLFSPRDATHSFYDEIISVLSCTEKSVLPD